VPMRPSVPVRMVTDWIPGPLSHPYPAFGSCRTAPTVNGNPGAGTVPDCERVGGFAPVYPPAQPLFENLKAAGLPLPDSYAGSSFGSVEENMRIKLQAVRIGDILLASCSCEAQVDLIKNLESRLDDVRGNIYDGYDYPCTKVGTTWSCTQPRPEGVKVFANLTDAQVAHMRAEVHNDAKGWDDPANVAIADSEPTDPKKIFGNFTKTELLAGKGFHLVVGLGHTGDYDGYTVSFREFQSRESYRKALTSYGPHTADYMNTHLLDVARFLRDGTPIPPVPNAAQGDADERRAQAEATALGRLGAFYLDGWDATRSGDAGPAAVTKQPRTIERFDAATVTWRGGSNWTDNPTVKVQRRVNGRWTDYADQSGEIVTTLSVPSGVTLATERTGTQEWLWTATFEAFDAWPRADVDGGQVPSGTYRFVVDGHIHSGGSPKPYSLQSTSFDVQPWRGLSAGDPKLIDGDVVVRTAPVAYPRSYRAEPSFRFLKDDGGDKPGAASVFCRTCSFRPWARAGTVRSVAVTVTSSKGSRLVAAVRQPDGSWRADTNLQPGERAFVGIAGVTDSYGELNGRATRYVDAAGQLSSPAGRGVSAAPAAGDLPRTGLPRVAPALALLLLGAAVVLRRRRA